MADAEPTRPPFTGHFSFSVGGIEIGTFTEVSGLSVQVEVEEVAEGGQNQFVHKLPGRVSWPPIVLKRGVADPDSLFAWLAETSWENFAGEGDRLVRQEGEVALLDASGEVVRRWEFEAAFPVKWNGPTLAASSGDVAVEELEIVHHGFRSAK